MQLKNVWQVVNFVTSIEGLLRVVLKRSWFGFQGWSNANTIAANFSQQDS